MREKGGDRLSRCALAATRFRFPGAARGAMLSLIVLAATAADRERALAALCAHEFR